MIFPSKVKGPLLTSEIVSAHAVSSSNTEVKSITFPESIISWAKLPDQDEKISGTSSVETIIRIFSLY